MISPYKRLKLSQKYVSWITQLFIPFNFKDFKLVSWATTISCTYIFSGCNWQMVSLHLTDRHFLALYYSTLKLLYRVNGLNLNLQIDLRVPEKMFLSSIPRPTLHQNELGNIYCIIVIQIYSFVTVTFCGDLINVEFYKFSAVNFKWPLMCLKADNVK